MSHLYSEQFTRDFSDFLKSRSKELIFGGSMILSFLGRRDYQSIGEELYIWGLLAEALNTMVSKVDEYFFHLFSKKLIFLISF